MFVSKEKYEALLKDRDALKKIYEDKRLECRESDSKRYAQDVELTNLKFELSELKKLEKEYRKTSAEWNLSIMTERLNMKDALNVEIKKINDERKTEKDKLIEVLCKKEGEPKQVTKGGVLAPKEYQYYPYPDATWTIGSGGSR